MAFTYTGALDTDLEKVRFRVGDTDSADALLTDAEITGALTNEGSVTLAALACVRSILARFAKGYDFSTDGQAFSRGQRVAHYTALLEELQTESGVTSNATTRLDGYSTDIDYSESDAPNAATGRVRQGYYDSDVPY